jgi:mannose-6-phosphate isomerase-like protein (cupin superfamily)
MAEFTGMKEAVDSWRFKRIVVEANEKGKSHIVTEKVSNAISRPNLMHRADIWSVKEVPVDNSITGDRALDQKQREPFPGGLVCRSLIMWPDNPDKEAFIKSVKEIHQSVKQTHMPTEEDYQRHPNMHRTDSLDIIAVVEGEMYLVTDEDETLMRPGDVCVIKGVNHAWANRSDKPCVTIGVMVDAKVLA